MSIVFHRPESPFDFTPELALKGTTVGERFTVDQNTRREQYSAAYSERLSPYAS